MADYPPFMNSYGLIPKILEKIKEARTPPRFTIDFLGSLGYAGGSARPFIPFAKRLGLLSSDGTPTETYTKFLDPNHFKNAMADAIRHGYAKLYERNEYAHKLDRPKLEGLIIQATGLDKDSGTILKETPKKGPSGMRNITPNSRNQSDERPQQCRNIMRFFTALKNRSGILFATS